MKIDIKITINPDKENPRLPRQIAILMYNLHNALEGFRDSTGTDYQFQHSVDNAKD